MAHSSIGLPPDSTGSRLNTHTHDIDGEIVHNQIMSIGDVNHQNFQSIDEYGAATVKFASGGMDFDSFGKAKMSQEVVLSNFIPEFDDEADLYNVVTAGTVLDTYVHNEKSIRFGVDTVSGDSITRTSKRYHKYIAGVSNTIMMTVNAGMPKENVLKRWGYFDEYNGIFFEHNGLEAGLVIRSNVTGTPVDTKVVQADYNGDKLDGTGVSGITANPSKSQIFWIDFQWLGAGIVRWGLVAPDGSKILIHTMKNTNNNNTVYMSSANLPIRHEITNTGNTASATEMKIHNSVVIMNNNNPNFSGPRYSVAIPSSVSIDNNMLSVLTFKQKDLFKGAINHSVASPVLISLWSDKTIAYNIRKKTTFSNTPTYTDVGVESTVEYSTDAVISTTGDVVAACGILDSGAHKVDLYGMFSYLTECLSENDEYTLMIKTLIPAETGNVIAGICWEEMRMA